MGCNAPQGLIAGCIPSRCGSNCSMQPLRLTFRVKPALLRTLLLSGVLLLPGSVCAHGSLHGAINKATKRIRENPTDGNAYAHRGRLRMLHGEREAAVADLDKAIELGVPPDRVALDVAEALTRAGRYREALPYIDEYLQQHPEASRALLQKARVYAALTNAAASAAAYREMIRVSKRTTPDIFVAAARQQALTGDVDGALALLDRAVEQLGDLAVLHQSAMELALEHQRYDDALRHVDAQLTAVPGNVHWLVLKARVQVAAGDAEAARVAAAEARAAIGALPVRRRQTPLVRELRSEVMEILERHGDR